MTTTPPSLPDGFPGALTGRIQAIVDAALSLAPRTLRLPDMLQAQLLHTDVAALLRALQDMHHAVGAAEPESPQAVWRRSWPFRSRQSATRLQERFAESLDTHVAVLARFEQLRTLHTPQRTPARHSLDRLARHRAELDPRVRQGQELLAQLWDDLRPQRPDPEDHENLRQLRAVLADVDRHRVALQRLDGVCGSAADVLRLGDAVLAGRDEIAQLLGPAFEQAWDQWRAQVEPLANGDAAPQELLAGTGGAPAARAALLVQVDRARVACTRLQIDEQALAQTLVHLREQLAPFAGTACAQ